MAGACGCPLGNRGTQCPKGKVVALAVALLLGSGEFTVGIRHRILEVRRGGNQTSRIQKVVCVAE